MLDGWVNSWWQATCLPRAWDVAGVPVNALSVWHLWALENMGNHYITGGAATQDDAVALLMICETDVEGGRRLLIDKRKRHNATNRLCRHVKKQGWAALNAACRDYVETCTRVPDRWSSGEGGNSLRAPYQLHLIRVLCSDFGTSAEEAWNTPYAFARICYDCKAEADGDTSIVSIEQEAVGAELEAKNIDPKTGSVRDGSNS